MHRFFLFGVAVLALALPLPASRVDACDYSMNVFNHRLGGDQLRLYMEMQKAIPLPGQMEVDVKKFDQVHSLGDGEVSSVGTYQHKGNGLATMLMLDRSASMARLQAKERDAAIQYIDSMDPQDQIALYFFAQGAKTYGFSDQAGELRQRVHGEMRGNRPKPMPGTATPLYKHLVDAINTVSADAQRELAFVLVMTDGQEEVGGYTADEVIKTAREKKVAVFAVGFYHVWYKHGRRADNTRELQLLEKIATGTGGKYVLADAASDLPEIFVYARKRARSFIVMDSTLCGLTRQDVAQSSKVDVQVRYEDCSSNTYSVSLPPLEKDLSACPECRDDTGCKDDEACGKQGRCEKLPCTACQKAGGHLCSTAACSTDGDCPSGCSCASGSCAERPPCNDWQVFDDDEKKCLGKPCQDDGGCGDPAQLSCCRGRCAQFTPCQPWMTREAGTCNCLDIRCWHDAQCPAGILCDGEYCADPTGAQVQKASCADGKLSVNGKCAVVKCQEDNDCLAEGVQEKWICGPDKGLSAKQSETRTCQLLRKEPCEEWEEPVEGGCHTVLCDKDEDCPEAGSCNQQEGECIEGGGLCSKNPLICGGVAGFAILAVVFLFMAVRRTRKQEIELEPAVGQQPQLSVSSRTQVKEEPARGTLGDPSVRETGGHKAARPESAAPAASSPFVLETNIQGHVERRPLSFGVSTIGREHGTIIIPHDIVSSSHLTLDIRDQGIFVTDVGSTNGTFLEGRKLERNVSTRLMLDQELMLGGTVKLYIRSPMSPGGPPPARKGQTKILD